MHRTRTAHSRPCCWCRRCTAPAAIGDRRPRAGRRSPRHRSRLPLVAELEPGFLRRGVRTLRARLGSSLGRRVGFGSFRDGCRPSAADPRPAIADHPIAAPVTEAPRAPVSAPAVKSSAPATQDCAPPRASVIASRRQHYVLHQPRDPRSAGLVIDRLHSVHPLAAHRSRLRQHPPTPPRSNHLIPCG